MNTTGKSDYDRIKQNLGATRNTDAQACFQCSGLIGPSYPPDLSFELGPWIQGHYENWEKFVEDEIQRYLAEFPQIFSFDKQRELISQFKFLLNQAKAEKFGTQCDDAWSCLGPVLKF